jgi:rubrerythrin
VDVKHGNQEEAELTRLIEKRSRNGEQDPAEREELWMESTRRYHERQREQNRWEWIRHFDRMAESHAQLSLSYRERAERLFENQHNGEDYLRRERMSLKDRIRRLERGEGCPECLRVEPVTHVVYPEDDHDPEPERCPKCGRVLGVIIRVEYVGGGGKPY